MNDFVKLSEMAASAKARLNALYDEPHAELIARGLEICGFESGDTARIAVLRRIVDLKEDPLLQEFRRLGYDEARQRELKSKMYDFTREIHESMHAALIAEAGAQGILQPFYLELLKGIHRIGLVLSDMQKSWQTLIIEGTNKRLQKEFSSLAQAKEFLLQEELFMRTPHGEVCERCYGAIVQRDGKSQMVPYAVAFADETAKLQSEFSDLLERLVTLAEDESELAYVAYLGKLKQAFCEKDASAAIGAWRDAEIAWMDIKTPLQIGHPLEYYEDAYTHAVALEWDVRLAGAYEFSAEEFKARVSESFERAYEKIGANNAVMHSLVLSNIAKTQLYVCAPLIYYGADLNGLFSAQVVPNDEFVSTNCGKKIFAFVNFVYESAKSKPFMRLSSEIFDLEYLNFGREILFKKPQIWRRVYEISTIGHEFGHIFFIDADTEARMNRSGLFKLIEEYKATTGGLVNFFFHEEEEFCLPVLDELIRRAVGLIAWQQVEELKPYYCEALIHLSLLFASGVLKFDGMRLAVKFDRAGYESFKAACLQNYEELARLYCDKKDAAEFLSRFAELSDGVYLPREAQVREFVKFYYSRYEAIGNETDPSNERAKWL
ncbi:invasion protein CiaB [uncultured Campylobacter sp.]|uniref:invasion protein CiaB n=1 Tax=uncultured Campylobacter sp. TaxID=218934 RepID=UPI002617E4A0|nr:invasion protein CiaB [uncultured Campylobacter sp.]